MRKENVHFSVSRGCRCCHVGPYAGPHRTFAPFFGLPASFALPFFEGAGCSSSSSPLDSMNSCDLGGSLFTIL